MEHRIFSAKIEDLESMIGWVRSVIAKKTTLKEHDFRKIELAMEEALVNIIFHAYPRCSKRACLEVIIRFYEDQRLEFKIIDKGFPFNPLRQIKQLQDQINLEETEEGGLGISLIRQCMDEIHYERQHPFNILTLIKKQ